MKKLVKVILCIAMCFCVLAVMGVAVSAKDATYPCVSYAVLTNPGGGTTYYGSAYISCSREYTSYDIYWSTIGIGSDDTGGSSYGVINISNTVYSMPTLDVDWSWMSYNLGTYDFGTYQATRGW